MNWDHALMKVKESWRSMVVTKNPSLSELRQLHVDFSFLLDDTQRSIHQAQLSALVKRIGEFKKSHLSEEATILSSRQIENITALLNNNCYPSTHLKDAPCSGIPRPKTSSIDHKITQAAKSQSQSSSSSTPVFSPVPSDVNENFVGYLALNDELRLMIQSFLINPLLECKRGARMISELTLIFVDWFSCVTTLKDLMPTLGEAHHSLIDEIEKLLSCKHHWLPQGGFESSPCPSSLLIDLQDLLSRYTEKPKPYPLPSTESSSLCHDIASL